MNLGADQRKWSVSRLANFVGLKLMLVCSPNTSNFADRQVKLGQACLPGKLCLRQLLSLFMTSELPHSYI